jgi:GNAT superfamily N-acetyltransferase
MAKRAAKYRIRKATPADMKLILAQRRAIIIECGYTDMRKLNAMLRAYAPWLRRNMRAGAYRAWFAVAPDGSVAAGAGLYVMPWHPVPSDITLRRGYVANVYTDPAHRRQGLAKRLMKTIFAWCRARKFKTVVLHASDAGTPLYESLGFKRTNEMRLVFARTKQA